MLKKTIWIALIFSQFICSQTEKTAEEIAAEAAKKAAEQTFNDTLLLGGAAYSAIKIGRTAYKIGLTLIPKTSIEEVRTQAIKNEIEILKTEADFKKCLVDNALATRQEDWFPSECKQQANVFSQTNSMKEYKSIKHEFIESSSRILVALEKNKAELEKSKQPGMSTTKKIIVGGLAVGTVGAFWWLGGPAIIMAKLVAAKGVVTTVSAVAVERAAEAASNLNPRTAIASFAALESGDKLRHVGGAIIGTAGVIENVEFVTKVAYTSDEERLAQLIAARQTQAPLFERMKAAHIKDPK